MDSDELTCGTCRHGNLQDDCAQCEKDAAAELMREYEVAIVAASVPEGCKWTLTEPTDEDLWESACGAAWTFIDGGPTENGMRFCLACGRVLEVVAPKPGDGKE